LFWGRLFFPTAQLLVTPDFGRSDAWDFSYGMKYALWEALQNHTLPLWENSIGSGFPLFAEGQIGALFLPNLLLFQLHDPVTAYNIALVSAVFILMTGMYCWSRLMGFRQVSALWGALTIGFSGPVVAHMTHITLLQGMSLFPWMAASTLLLARRGTILSMLLLATLGAQQMFAGFPQATFLTMLFCGSYLIAITSGKTRFLRLGLFVGAMLFVLGLGAVQLLPSAEFLKETTHPTGFDAAISSYFSFPLNHLLTFLWPFALGNPQNGSYPPFFKYDGSIFWENVGYVGILPLVLALYAILKSRSVISTFSFGVFLAGILLAWGKHSPMYFLYTFWPLNLFRVPSRFLWIAVIGVVLASVIAVDMFLKKNSRIRNAIAYIVLLVHVSSLFFIWWHYHLLVPAQLWLAAPPAAKSVASDRVYTVGAGAIYNTYFVSKGWKDSEPYLFLRNSLEPNGSIAWGVHQYSVTSGRILRRTSTIDDLLQKEFTVTDHYATPSAVARKLLNAFAVGSIASYYNTTANGLVPLDTLSFRDTTLQLFDNPTALPRAHLVFEATTAATLREALTYFEGEAFNPETTVLLEKHEYPDILSKTKLPITTKNESVTILTDTDREMTISVWNNPFPSYLVVADTQYPGWKATIDGVDTQIFTANLTQRAIVVPPGNHHIIFLYEPASVQTGMRITLVFWVITILLAAGSLWPRRPQIRRIVVPPLKHRPRNPYR